MHPSIDDVGKANALVDGIGAGPKLWDHSPANALVRDPFAKLGRCEPGNEGVFVACIFEQAGNSGQIDDLFRTHRDRDGPCRLVRVDVVWLTLGICADRRDHRREAIVEEAMNEFSSNLRDVADKAERGIDGLTVNNPASSPDTPTATGSSPA